MYKPANLVLRSGIEAFVKAIGIAADQKVLTITSVFEVFGIVASVDLIRDNALTSRCYESLYTEYKELCKYAHNAGPSYMSLTSAIGVFPKYNEADFELFGKRSRGIIVNMCSILAIFFNFPTFTVGHPNSLKIIHTSMASQLCSANSIWTDAA
jgi:hypothetical protein